MYCRFIDNQTDFGFAWKPMSFHTPLSYLYMYISICISIFFRYFSFFVILLPFCYYLSRCNFLCHLRGVHRTRSSWIKWHYSYYKYQSYLPHPVTNQKIFFRNVDDSKWLFFDGHTDHLLETDHLQITNDNDDFYCSFALPPIYLTQLPIIIKTFIVRSPHRPFTWPSYHSK